MRNRNETPIYAYARTAQELKIRTWVINVTDTVDPKNNNTECFDHVVDALAEIARMFSAEIIEENIHELIDGEEIWVSVPDYGAVSIKMTNS